MLPTRHLADQHQKRHRILLRRVNGDREVGGTGAAADRNQPGAPGQLGIGQSHEAGTALLAADQGRNLTPVGQGIQQGQVALAGHAEETVQAVRH